MPGGARKSRAKPPYEPEKVKSQPSRGSSKTPTTSNHKNRTATSTIDEPGDHQRGTSSSSCAKSPTTNRQPQVKNQRGSALTLPSIRGSQKGETGTSSQSKRTLSSGSSRYLNQHVRELLLERKKEIVDRLMAQIEEYIDQKLEILEEPCDGEGCSSEQPSPSHGSSSGKTGNSSKRQSIGKKRQIQRDDNDGNKSEDDDDSRRNRNNKRPKMAPDENPERKYACPYYKFNPKRFEDSKTCSGPGWGDIHRLKEHLKRTHLLPEFHCHRCLQSFKKQTELVQHLRAANPCAIEDAVSSSRDFADGFNNEQKEKLEKRTRNKPGHERWVEWYCILFDVEPSSTYIPSPFRRDPDSGNWREGHTDHCLYAEYIDHLRQVVLPLYRQQLEIEVEKFLNGCENPIGLNFLNQLPAIATSVFQNISPPPPGFIGGHTTGGTGNTKTAIPYAFDPAQLLDGLESQFQPADAFDFNSLNNGPCFEDSSYTSGLSDGFDATDGSSNTSADESSAKGQTLTGQQPLRLPEQFSQVPFDPNYYSYGLLGAGGYDYQP